VDPDLGSSIWATGSKIGTIGLIAWCVLRKFCSKFLIFVTLNKVLSLLFWHPVKHRENKTLAPANEPVFPCWKKYKKGGRTRTFLPALITIRQ